MLDLGFALFDIALAVGLLVALRRHGSLKRQFEQLAREHEILADRVLIFGLNRVPADSIAPSAILKAEAIRRDRVRYPDGPTACSSGKGRNSPASEPPPSGGQVEVDTAL